mmetsp:Transcript_74564/g.205603  ORF Transcript_74564/g.205603 Transcript_74564/m.205603 type:complete len:272 (-) Transcript_74564:290-1105(-)
MVSPGCDICDIHPAPPGAVCDDASSSGDGCVNGPTAGKPGPMRGGCAVGASCGRTGASVDGGGAPICGGCGEGAVAEGAIVGVTGPEGRDIGRDTGIAGTGCIGIVAGAVVAPAGEIVPTTVMPGVWQGGAPNAPAGCTGSRPPTAGGAGTCGPRVAMATPPGNAAGPGIGACDGAPGAVGAPGTASGAFAGPGPFGSCPTMKASPRTFCMTSSPALCTACRTPTMLIRWCGPADRLPMRMLETPVWRIKSRSVSPPFPTSTAPLWVGMST